MGISSGPTTSTNNLTNSNSTTSSNAATDLTGYQAQNANQSGFNNQTVDQQQGQNSTTSGTTANNAATATSNSSNPAAWQMPFIDTGLSTAQQLLNEQMSSPYVGQNYTSISPEEQAALDSLSGYATGTAAPTMNTVMQNGASATGALSGAQTAANDVLSMATTDPTQANIAAATEYADNPYTEQMVTAANTPIEQQLNEQELTGLNSAASQTGNMDSSRAAQTSAIMQRDASTQEANNAANIYGNEYNQGLTLAEQSNEAAMNAALGASNAMTGIGSTGSTMATNANTAAINDMGVPIQTGQIQQNDANAANQIAYNNELGAQQYPWTSLNNYWSIAGNPLGTETNGYTDQSSYGSQNQAASSLADILGTTGTTYGQASTADAASSGAQNTNATGNTTQNGMTSGTQTTTVSPLSTALGIASGIGSFFAM